MEIMFLLIHLMIFLKKKFKTNIFYVFIYQKINKSNYNVPQAILI